MRPNQPLKTIDNNRQRQELAPKCPCGKVNHQADGKAPHFAPYRDMPAKGGYCHAASCQCPRWFEKPVDAMPRRDTDEVEAKRPGIDMVNRTLVADDYIYNPLARYLFKLFPDDKATLIAHFQRWLFGNYWEHGDKSNMKGCFWQADQDGPVRVKIMDFVLKDKPHPKTGEPWQTVGRGGLTLQPLKAADGYATTLYGLHLLDRSKPVRLVESEKTAMIAGLLLPEYNWLATGGAGAINWSKARALQGLKVMVLPDNDTAGLDGAQALVRKLAEFQVPSVVANLWPESAAAKIDLADWLLAGIAD